MTPPVTLADYQREFIEFALDQQVLGFGEFTLKSGRVSPYFFNAGRFDTGARLARLGRYYAAAIEAAELDWEVLLGPAYKGIPLVSATAVQLAEQHGRQAPWAFNRKEPKDHGEGGLLVGAPIEGRKVLIVDDIITAGTAIREVIQIVADAGAEVAGVVVSIDRQERGTGALSAVDQVRREHAIPVISIVALDHLIAHLEQTGAHAEHLPAVQAYRDRYGVAAS